MPGARALSIQQWALSIADSMTSSVDVHSAVRLTVAVALLAVVIVAGTWLAGWRLRSFTLSHTD